MMSEPMGDRLRHELDMAAAHIDSGNASAGLEAVHANARRRRRRRVGGLAALGVVVVAAAAVGALAVTGDPEADRITSADPTTTVSGTTTTATTASTTTAAPGTTAPGTTAPGTSAPGSAEGADPEAPSEAPSSPRVVTAASAAPVEVPGLLGDADVGGRPADWLVPWHGGFLAGTTEVIQPSAAPLSEELRSRFPQEVLDLFADGLPPTVNESQQMLAEAGLLDEVTEIVTNDPELYDALFAATPQVHLMVGTSVDGETWTPVELELPVDLTRPDQVTATGDRLVVVGHTERAAETSGEGESGPEEIVVASTTDLQTWDVVSLPTGVPASVPEPLATFYGPNQIAVNDSGWVLDVGDGLTIEPEPILDELGIDPEGYGGFAPEVISDPPGIRLRFFGMNGSDVLAERVVTWDEIGIDEAMQDQVASLLDTGPGGTRWSSTWEGDPVETPSEGFDFQVAALGSGFLELGDPIRFSPDGQTWAAVDTAPSRHWASALLPTGTGAVVLTQDRSGASHAYLIDDTAETWEEIVIDGAPPGLQPYQSGPESSAIVVNRAVPDGRDSTVVIDGDGGRLTMIDAGAERSYELVDPDGAILAEESIDVLVTDDFEHLSHADDGSITIVDEATGEPLYTASQDQLNTAYSEAFPDDAAMFPEEDRWLLATSDGERWLVHDLPDPDPSGEGWWPGPAAVSGDTVLVTGNDAWLRFELPS